MKPATEKLLENVDQAYLMEILDNLCQKYKFLEGDIAFLVAPKKVKFAQSYYNRLVKLAIDTNSYSKFPLKGVRGLNEMLIQAKHLNTVGNSLEARKLAKAVYEIVARCERNYNTNNEEDLDTIKYQLIDLLR